MARGSTLLRQMEALEAQWSDEASRYTDFVVRFREVDYWDGALRYTGRVSEAYGGVFDAWAAAPDGTLGWYIDREPSLVHWLDANPAQFSALTDDETFHLLYVGSRRSSKTELLARWLVKQIAQWPKESLSVVCQKRSKARKLVEEKLLPLLPVRWLLPGRAGVRRSQDELAIRLRHGGAVDFLSGRVPDDARGDGIPALGIDETQIVPPEARENAMLSMSEGGSRLQSLETATALAGEFQDYFESSQKNPRYRCEMLSITDNVHLERTYDPVTGLDLPEFILSARSTMDPRRFEQEVGKFDPPTGRYIPQFVAPTGLIYYAFGNDNRLDHSEDFRENETLIRRLYASAHPGVGQDITRTRYRADYLIGVAFGPRPMAAVVCKVYRAPPGHLELLWAIDEVFVEGGEGGPTQLAKELVSRGYGGRSGRVGEVVPDAAGRQSVGRRSSIDLIAAERLRISGPIQNPAEADRLNGLNAKLLNASEQRGLVLDKRCRRTIAALRNQRCSDTGKETVLPEGDHVGAWALGMLVHFYWTPAAATSSVSFGYA